MPKSEMLVSVPRQLRGQCKGSLFQNRPTEKAARVGANNWRIDPGTQKTTYAVIKVHFRPTRLRSGTARNAPKAAARRGKLTSKLSWPAEKVPTARSFAWYLIRKLGTAAMGVTKVLSYAYMPQEQPTIKTRRVCGQEELAREEQWLAYCSSQTANSSIPSDEVLCW